MSGTLMLVNPRARRARRATPARNSRGRFVKRNPAPARRRAVRAAARPRPVVRHVAARPRPVVRRRRARRGRPAGVHLRGASAKRVYLRPRRGRKGRSTVVYRNPRRRYSMRRRNPSARGFLNGIMGQVMTAAKGAAGALAVNAILNYVPFPTMLVNTPAKRYLMRGALALLIGSVGKRFMGASLADDMSRGALTFVIAQAAADYAGRFSGGKVMLADASDYIMQGMGYISPGETVSGYSSFPMESAFVDNVSLPGQDLEGYDDYGQPDGMGQYVGGMGEYVGHM